MHSETRTAPERRSTYTIMMVDDESTTLDVIEAFLQSEGYERFVVVEDSRVAVATALEHRPDVLLLDLMMPYVGGLEILTEMREHPLLRHTPVVILTSSTDSETKLKALELGATDFLAKPVDPSELALRLRNTLTAKAYQDQLAYYDEDTGLPNRRRFTELLEEFLVRARAESGDGAIMQLGLHRFRQIADALGREASDEVAKIVAARLQTSLHPAKLMGNPHAREVQLVARATHDEFLILVEGAGCADRAARIARYLLAQLQAPCRVAGQDLAVAGRVGITLFPDDGLDAETLLGNASVALSHAHERSGGDGFGFHDESLNAASRERLTIESRLRDALLRGELQLHYQPKVDLRSGRIVGAEALARWDSPTLGSVPPGRFIPIAEESDLIVRLGEWTLRTACWQIRAWLDAGFPPICIAVNVSSRQFRTGELTHVVASALAENQLDGGRLILELTESMIMENPTETARILQGLKRLGVTISVDDFGTGFSSLSTLKRFPIDELKIDRSFVKGTPDDGDDCAIVAAVIAMGHALGMRLVAEGVETEPQRDFLRERGCELYQGYLCSKALSAADWPMLLSQMG